MPHDLKLSWSIHGMLLSLSYLNSVPVWVCQAGFGAPLFGEAGSSAKQKSDATRFGLVNTQPCLVAFVLWRPLINVPNVELWLEDLSSIAHFFLNNAISYDILLYVFFSQTKCSG